MDRKSALLALLGCCLFFSRAPVARGDDDVPDAANPYSIIAERNVFHLNPPPPPAPPPEPTKADLPIIKITGIVRIGNQVRALFVEESKDKKETPTYYNLAAGERQGILEVVKIDPEGQKVDVINSGKAATLTVKEDSLAKSEGSAPPGAVTGTNPAAGPRQFPQFPSFNNRRTPPPSFPGASVPGSAAPASPFPVPMRTRRTTYGGAPGLPQ